MTEWQPIETAPKDGTDVSIWIKGSGLDGWWVPDAYWDTEIENWRDKGADPKHRYPLDDDDTKVTHWRPIPRGPNGEDP